jgi:DNA-binding NtrC family response regulator
VRLIPDSVFETIKTGEIPVRPPKNEKELIVQALQSTNFSKPKSAALLGTHRTTLYRKLKKIQNYGFLQLIINYVYSVNSGRL